MNTTRTIQWRRDISGQEVELMDGKNQVLTPVPFPWSYKKGQKTSVRVVKESTIEWDLEDLDAGHRLSRVPTEAFEVLAR